MAFGFRPAQAAGAGYNTSGALEYPIRVSAVATDIFNGDTVKYTTGTSTTDWGIEVNTAPLDTADSCGIFVGSRWVDADGNQKWGQYYNGAAGNTEAYAFIAPLTNRIFEIQAAVAWNDNFIGWLNIPTPGSGSTTTGNSGIVIALAAADGANAPCKIVGVKRDGKNETSAVTTPIVYVRFIDLAIDQLG